MEDLSSKIAFPTPGSHAGARRGKDVRSSVVSLQVSVKRADNLAANAAGGVFGALPKRTKGAFAPPARSSHGRGTAPVQGARRSVKEVKLEMDRFMQDMGAPRPSAHNAVDMLVVSSPPSSPRGGGLLLASRPAAVMRPRTSGGGGSWNSPSKSLYERELDRAHGRAASAAAGGAPLTDLVLPEPTHQIQAIEFSMSHQFDHLLPSARGRKGGGRTPDLLWQTRKMLPAPPTGVRYSNMLEGEASAVFCEGRDPRRALSTPGGFVEANAYEFRMHEILNRGRNILAQPPQSEAQGRYNLYVTTALVELISDLADAIGPFGAVLRHAVQELHPFAFSEQRQTVHIPGPVGGGGVTEELAYVPWIEVVSMQKREADRMAATLTSASTLTAQAARDLYKFQLANKQLEARGTSVEEVLKGTQEEFEALQGKHARLIVQHEELRKRFEQLQRGFLLGHLQDEVKEMLMEGFGGDDKDPTKKKVNMMAEEQSAMQKLVQQLKDAREGMLHARDDMNYWKSKYDGLEERMKNLRDSFQDAKNSLDLQKEKMLGMVPSTVHVALKERYAKLLSELGKQTAANQRMKRKLQPAAPGRDRPPDDWRNYARDHLDDGFDEDTLAKLRADAQQQIEAERKDEGGKEDKKGVGGAGVKGGGLWLDAGGKGTAASGSLFGQSNNSSDEYISSSDEEDKEDEDDRSVPKEFIDSVAAQRDKLLLSYRNFRRMHGMNVVSWMSLKNMTLAEFARLEADCFVKNSIWALGLRKRKKPKSSNPPTIFLGEKNESCS